MTQAPIAPVITGPDGKPMSLAEKKYLGCTQLTISTPTNPAYSGQVFGVKFSEGHALVNRNTPNRWKYSLEQIGAHFDTDLAGNGYVVTPEWLGATQAGPAIISPDPSPEPSADPDETGVGEEAKPAPAPKTKKSRSALGRAKLPE